MITRKKIIEKKSTFLFPDEKKSNFFSREFSVWRNIIITLEKMMNFDKNQKNYGLMFYYYLRSDWLSSLKSWFCPIAIFPFLWSVRWFPFVRFPSKHQYFFVRMHLVSSQLIEIKKISNFNPPIKRMNEKMLLPEAKT